MELPAANDNEHSDDEDEDMYPQPYVVPRLKPTFMLDLPSYFDLESDLERTRIRRRSSPPPRP